MKYQHSINATYVLVDDVGPNDAPCMMLHPRDPGPKDKEYVGGATLYPNLETALHYLDREANDFLAENSGSELVDVKQFHSPEYELAVFDESRPATTEVRDVTRILIYTKSEQNE